MRSNINALKVVDSFRASTGRSSDREEKVGLIADRKINRGPVEYGEQLDGRPVEWETS